MKFKFRLQSVMRQRKVEQDVAQRDHADAAAKLQAHLKVIQEMYKQIDEAKNLIEEKRHSGGSCSEELQQVDDFIAGQKIRIELARDKARELMSVEEEKLDVLTEKMRDLKVIEKLKELREAEFKKTRQKKMAKELDDLVTTRYRAKG